MSSCPTSNPSCNSGCYSIGTQKPLTLKTARDIARTYGFASLVTKPAGNAKLSKSTGYYNIGISLAQAKLSGVNICPGSSKGCRASCLAHFGRAEDLPAIVETRIARTKLLASDPDLFWQLLEPELLSADRYAEKQGIEVALRPDMFSDYLWHRKLPQLFEFSNWNIYGYTKNRAKIRDYMSGNCPENYYLTYSRSERDSVDDIRAMLKDGLNVAIPFFDARSYRGTIPNFWYGMPVIDGDKSDLRFLDPSGVIVGLKTKLPKSRVKAVKVINESNGFFVGV